MNKKKLVKYLNSKDKSIYSNLDKIFLLYNSNELYKILKYNGATNIEFYPTINSKDKSLQVYFNYYNMCASVEILERNEHDKNNSQMSWKKI